MFRKISIAVIVAILTAIGVVIPTKYIDSFVTLFAPSAEAATIIYRDFPCRPMQPLIMQWESFPYEPVSSPNRTAVVEALRPSSPHFSGDRSNLSRLG